MAENHPLRFGLLVRSASFCGRSARDQLDIALAAATLDWTLELFFLGPGSLQLLEGCQPSQAGLPRGLRAWKSLADLTEVKAWVVPGVRERLFAAGHSPLIKVDELAESDMALRLAHCDQVWVV